MIEILEKFWIRPINKIDSWPRQGRGSFDKTPMQTSWRQCDGEGDNDRGLTAIEYQNLIVQLGTACQIDFRLISEVLKVLPRGADLFARL